MQRKGNWLGSSLFQRRYRTHAELFVGLQAEEDRAILELQNRALPTVRKLVRESNLTADLAEELLNQGTLIFLQKIASGSYQFQGYAPTTYLLEVVKRLILAAGRKKRHQVEDLEDHHELPDPEQDRLARVSEATATVRTLLDHLGDPCARVIRLHHLAGYRDEEVVRRKMTPYTTVNSLKMKRSDCMKKLIKLAQRWKTVNSI